MQSSCGFNVETVRSFGFLLQLVLTASVQELTIQTLSIWINISSISPVVQT